MGAATVALAADAIARSDICQEARADSVTIERLMQDPGVSIVTSEVMPSTGFRLQTFRFLPR